MVIPFPATYTLAKPQIFKIRTHSCSYKESKQSIAADREQYPTYIPSIQALLVDS